MGSAPEWAQQARGEVFAQLIFIPFFFTTDFQLCTNPASSGHGIKPCPKVLVFVSHVLDTPPSPALLSAWVEGESC